MRSRSILLFGSILLYSSSTAALHSGIPTSSLFPTAHYLIPRQEKQCARSSDQQCPLSNPPPGGSDKYCCPQDTDCIGLANDSAGLCCKKGAICSRVGPVSCSADAGERALQEQCGTDMGNCCPRYYTCRAGQCVLKEENLPGLPDEWVALARTGEFQTIGQNCTMEVEAALAEEATQHKEFPVKAVLVGFFPGLAAGAFFMFVIFYAMRLRDKRQMVFNDGATYRSEETKMIAFPVPVSGSDASLSKSGSASAGAGMPRAASRNTASRNTTRGGQNHSRSESRNAPSATGSRRTNTSPGPVLPRSAASTSRPTHGHARQHTPVINEEPPRHIYSLAQQQPAQSHQPREPIQYIPVQATHFHPPIPHARPQSARTSLTESTDSDASSFHESTIGKTMHGQSTAYAYAQALNRAGPSREAAQQHHHQHQQHTALHAQPPNRLAVLSPVASIPLSSGGGANASDATSCITDAEEFVQEKRREIRESRLVGEDFFSPTLVERAREVRRLEKEKAPRPGG